MNLILITVLFPVIISPVLLVLSDRWRRYLVALFISGLLFTAFYLLYAIDLKSTWLFTSMLEQHGGPALLSFSMHPYSKIAAFGFTFVGALGLLYGLQVSKASEQLMSLAAIASAVGVAFADNFITFLIFWELLTFTTSMLIFLKGTAQAKHMAYRVFFLQLIGGFCLTVGIILNYHATGAFALQTPAAGLPFFIVGIGLKAAFLPLHFWVPWGYPAASFPSSVLLAALCTKVGVYGVARILPASNELAFLGALMAIVAVSFAIIQSDLRRLLSFHIISQVGYMVAGVGLGSYLSVDGGLLHLVNHMIYKALLFMSAGALIFTSGTENIHELHHPKPDNRGPAIWRVLPIAAVGALVGALAISGVPFFNGYVSKYLLKKAVHGVNPVEWMLLAAGVGTAFSFSKFVYFGFIKASAKLYRRPTVSMELAIIASAASCIILGLWPDLLSTLIPHNSSLHVYSLKGAITALQYITIGIVLFIGLARYLEKIKFPYWLNADRLVYTPVASGSLYLFTSAGKVIDRSIDRGIVDAPATFSILSRGLLIFEENLLIRLGRWISSRLSEIREAVYNTWVALIGAIFGNLARYLKSGFQTLFQVDYRPKRRIFQTINTSNLDFNLLIIVLTLIVILGITFIVRLVN